eukprot:3109582-Rhodomonas_salina.3
MRGGRRRTEGGAPTSSALLPCSARYKPALSPYNTAQYTRAVPVQHRPVPGSDVRYASTGPELRLATPVGSTSYGPCRRRS